MLNGHTERGMRRLHGLNSCKAGDLASVQHTDLLQLQFSETAGSLCSK